MSTAIRAVATAAVAVLLISIGVVAGVAWQSTHDGTDTSYRPSVIDIGFAQDMSAHHDQAILMAQSLSPDAALEIRGLANRIVVSQTAETSTMRGWLTWFGIPVTSDHPMSWMDHPQSHHHGVPPGDGPPMPGMASVDELTRLSVAHGRGAEILFLQLMIRHHRGGIDMAVAAHNDARASSVTKQLALTMISDEGDEIGQMTLLLRAREALPLPT
ncbi:DUF305 domain-containing protein [Gordonia hankookensis]|uniref:DUF305 domain-containing protein n=1 Tax=Gordonia hankookensis TaxID=589403 RepID=A0ABR7WA35_9ACTN|nr:DUF305 domain-containing protein [Gordonia hankookensis]MBD1319676.1 DUF305 domain-containing protein [Gordonia hankookensis]